MERLQELQRQIDHLAGLLQARFRAAGLEAGPGGHRGYGVEAARFLEELGDALPTPLFFKDTSGRYTYVNSALARFLDLPRERFIGRRAEELLPPDLAEEIAASTSHLLATGLPQDEERRLPLPGGFVEVMIHRRVLRDHAGHPIGVAGAIQDQSLHHRAVSALRRSEVCHRGLFESALDATFILSEERVLEANPAALRLFGLPAAELADRHPLAHSPEIQPDGRPSAPAAKALLAAALAGERQIFAWTHRRGDGGTFDAEVSLYPLDLGGERRLIAIIRDVTARRRTEAALKASEEFNRGLIQHAPIGVVYVDLDGVLVYENPAMKRMLGVPKDSVSQRLGRPLAQLPGLGELSVAEILGRVAAGEVVRDLEADYRSAHGTRSRLLVQVSPHRDAGGAVIGAIFFIQDVTELRNLERQLQQAQKLEAIGSLAGGIAHDFNNLLTGILGNAELALQHLDQPGLLRDCLRQQLAVTQRAAELTRRLLAFSRQDNDAARPVHLGRLLGDLEHMLRRLLGESVALELTLDPELWAIRADPGQMEQIIVNLAVNARDAMPEGGRLIIRARNLERPEAGRRPPGSASPTVQLEVADTGCGIAEELRGRIFEPFFTTKDTGKGTGLGLAIVYTIVNRCGGSIDVDSQPGLGTSFRLTFPSIGPLAKVPAPAAAPDAGGELPRGRETVLVIEDEAAVRDLAVRLLEHCGYRVLSAADGPAALELAACAPVPADLIFSDVIMPGMSGPAAVRRLLDLWPRARVLFCSGYTDGELRRHDLSRAGEVELLVKPFTLEQLSRRVRQALDAPPPAPVP